MITKHRDASGNLLNPPPQTPALMDLIDFYERAEVYLKGYRTWGKSQTAIESV